MSDQPGFPSPNQPPQQPFGALVPPQVPQPPTMQMPWRMAAASERPTSGAPTAGAATSNTAAVRATAAMYSSVA